MAEAAVTGAAIKLALDITVKLAGGLYEMWSDYKFLKGDARALSDRVKLVQLEVNVVANCVAKSMMNEEFPKRVKQSLDLVNGILKEVDLLSKPLCAEVQKKAVLRRMFRFVISSSIAENINKIETKLQKVREELHGIKSFETLLDSLEEANSFHQIKDENGRTFWKENIGRKEWRAPLRKLLDAYEAAANEGKYAKLSVHQREAFLYALCSEEDEVTVAQKLRPDEETVYCYRFAAFCETYGWPFKPSDLKDPPQVRTVYSTSERLAVAQICLDLQERFSRPEMRQAITSLINTVNSVVKHMEANLDPESGEIQYSPNQDGTSEDGGIGYGPYQLHKLTQPATKEEQEKFRGAQMKCFAADYLLRSAAEKAGDGKGKRLELPNPDAEDPLSDASCTCKKSERPGIADAAAESSDVRGKRSDAVGKRTLREALDEKRRLWSFAFQKFAAFWKLGRLEEELFEGIDFPGTGRSITFMSYCEPLDEANLRLVINKNLDRSEPVEADSPDAHKKWKRDEASWEKSRPQVYTFLRAWIQYKDEKKAAAARYGLGGGAPVVEAPARRGDKVPTPVRFGGDVRPLGQDGTPKQTEKGAWVAQKGDSRASAGAGISVDVSSEVLSAEGKDQEIFVASNTPTSGLDFPPTPPPTPPSDGPVQQ